MKNKEKKALASSISLTLINTAKEKIENAGYKTILFPDHWFLQTINDACTYFENGTHKINPSEKRLLDALHAYFVTDLTENNFLALRKLVNEGIYHIEPNWGGWFNLFNTYWGIVADVFNNILNVKYFQEQYILVTKDKNRNEREEILNAMLTAVLSKKEEKYLKMDRSDPVIYRQSAILANAQMKIRRWSK